MIEPTHTTTDQPPERLYTPDTGITWTLRLTDETGEGRYAPDTVRECPRLVMARLSELVELGAEAVPA